MFTHAINPRKIHYVAEEASLRILDVPWLSIGETV